MTAAPRSRRKPKASRSTAALVPGALWGSSCLLICAAALLAPIGHFTGEAWLLTAAFSLLPVSALSLLTMVLYTLPREEAYDWNADLCVFPAVIRWPLQAGTWAGQAVVLLVMLWIALTSSGSTPEGGARFAMSVLAVLGAITTLFTAMFVPASLMIALLVVWGAVVVVALLRGIYGVVAAMVR